MLAATDLGLVSADRRDAELRRLAAEHEAAAGFRLLSDWEVLTLPAGAPDLLDSVAATRLDAAWSGDAEAGIGAMLIAAGLRDGAEECRRLAVAAPQRPSEAVAIARRADPATLLVATAAGGGWIERYVGEWRHVRLEIDGDDLLAAGVERGPAIGAGLAGALDRKLDGELDGGREAELAAAIEIAGRSA